MKRIASFVSLRNNADALLAAIAGFCMVLLFTRYGGIGVSPDSVVYTSVARTLFQQGALVDYNGVPLVDFPFFYPLFLGIVRALTQADPVAAGPWINGSLLALVVYGCGCLLRHWHPFYRWFKWMILFSIVISAPLLEIYSMLWSETLFIVWTLLFVLLCRHYLRAHRLTSLLALGACVSVACITRYAGISLLGTGGLLLLLHPALPWKKKLGHLLLFNLAGLLLPLLNLYRNYTITGTLTGPREKGVTPLLDNLRYYGNVLCDWLPFTPARWSLVIALFSLAVPAYFLLMRWLRKKEWHGYHNIFTALFLVYATFIVLSSTVSRYEQINNRLLSPGYIPFLFCFAGWIPGRLAQLHQRIASRLLAVVVPAAMLFQAGQLADTLYAYNEVKDYGVPGYTDDDWRLSPLIAYLKTHASLFKKDYPVYTNGSDALYITTGLFTVPLPHKIDREDLDEFLETPGHYVVWLNLIEDRDLVDLPFIRQHKNMQPLYQAADGVIYWCTPAAASPAGAK